MNTSERVVNVLMGMLHGEKLDLDRYRRLYGKSERTFHRDLEAIRDNEYFNEDHRLHYDTVQKKHYVTNKGSINSAEVLAIAKILVDSRALPKEELKEVINKLVGLVATEDQSKVKMLLGTTGESYISSVKNSILSSVEQFSKWITAKRSIAFKYNGSINDANNSKMQIGVPLSIHYDNHHFYIMMYLIDEDKTFLYRLDKFSKITPKGRAVNVPANKRPDIGQMINKNLLTEQM